jgi:hypothetical protein
MKYFLLPSIPCGHNQGERQDAQVNIEDRTMNLNRMKTEQFCEELYFMLMTSSLRDRIRMLGERHGLSNKGLRTAILSAAEPVIGRIESTSPIRVHDRQVLVG